MPVYRIYILTSDGDVEHAQVIASCENDEKPIERAKQMLDGQDLEVGDGTRESAP
jgi:hypothetical protein